MISAQSGCRIRLLLPPFSVAVSQNAVTRYSRYFLRRTGSFNLNAYCQYNESGWGGIPNWRVLELPPLPLHRPLLMIGHGTKDEAAAELS